MSSGAVAAAVAAVVALGAMAWPLLKHRVIYAGGKLAPDRADPRLHGLPDSIQLRLTAEDGVRIHAWWTPAHPDGSRGAVIYCHGNAESMATRAFIADRLARLGFDSLLFDYRGYGLSEGRASEEGLAMDARAAWRRVVEERGIAPDRVVLMGHSLGSAVAIRLALEIQAGTVGVEPEGDPGPAALVVGAPFPDMPTLFRVHAPWLPGFLLRWRTDRLDAGSRLGDVAAPTLVLMGTEDPTIPPEITRAVYRSARSARSADARVELVTAPADHSELMGHPAVWAGLDRFLDSLP